MRDHFRPHFGPAQTIYDRLLLEAENRKGRSSDEWMKAELQAVWLAARAYALKHDLLVPTMSAVEHADRQACGHTDYAAKVAHGVAAVMKKRQRPAADESRASRQ